MVGHADSPVAKAVLATALVGLAVVAPVRSVPFEPDQGTVPPTTKTLIEATTDKTASPATKPSFAPVNNVNSASPLNIRLPGKSLEEEVGTPSVGAITVAQTETTLVSQVPTHTTIGEPEKNSPTPVRHFFARTAVGGSSGTNAPAPYAYNNATVQLKPTASIHPTNYVSNASAT
jgi:hypothetical protein